MSILETQNVWKRFAIPHHKAERTVSSSLGTILSILGRTSYEEFWALKMISFDLNRGESLGLIGPNGSGKSTLLKLIAGIMRPDVGTIEIHAPIAAILELGLGFHADLTVRENILIYGVLMGIRRSEIRKKTDEILEFAGLTRFQDAQLKNLSSGMQVRLAFSISVQTRADIFILDEALSVGDVEFQRKCFDKFREFKKEGKSIILVSQSMELIREFCEKTLYLLHGEIRSFGPSDVATKLYIADSKDLG